MRRGRPPLTPMQRLESLLCIMRPDRERPEQWHAWRNGQLITLFELPEKAGGRGMVLMFSPRWSSDGKERARELGLIRSEQRTKAKRGGC